MGFVPTPLSWIPYLWGGFLTPVLSWMVQVLPGFGSGPGQNLRVFESEGVEFGVQVQVLSFS